MSASRHRQQLPMLPRYCPYCAKPLDGHVEIGWHDHKRTYCNQEVDNRTVIHTKDGCVAAERKEAK